MRSILIILFISFSVCCSQQSIETQSAEEYKAALDKYSTAKILFMNENWDQAEEMFKQLEQDNPDFFRATFMLGQIQVARKNYQKAEEIFKKLVDEYPQFKEAEMQLTRVLIYNKKYDLAAKRLEGLLKYDANDPRLQFLAAQLALTIGDLESARINLMNALLFKEELGHTQVALADVYTKMEEYDLALHELSSCKDSLPEGSLLKEDLPRYIEAVKKLKQETANNPTP